MQLRLPPVPVRWAIGLLAFVALFAWYTAPNPQPISDSSDPFVGRWLVNGVDPFGREYSGSLTIQPSGDGYRLDWIVTGALISGNGEVVDGSLTATWESDSPRRAATGTAQYHIADEVLVGSVRTAGVAGSGEETGERLPGE